ncbi:MAG: hypothetical protein PHR53_00885 [Bacteroidales bacterium]|nr:hypothetical protein [Bacteroidales bacterium]
MNTIHNLKGVPLISSGIHALISTTGMPKNLKSKGYSSTEKLDDYFIFNGIRYANWGQNNDFPDAAEKIISSTAVLRTALNYKSRCCYGQGVFPTRVTGYDEKGNEQLSVINDTTLFNMLRGYPFRNYHTAAFRDLIKFGNCFTLLVFNESFVKIIRTEVINARHCRISENKDKLLVYGGFKEGGTPDTANTVVYDMLSEDDPFYHLQQLKGKLKKHVVFPRIKNYFSNNDYYGDADWESAYNAGWIDVAHKIPTFLKKAYENAMSIMWHVQIPYAFFDKKFPPDNFKSVAERQSEIDKFLDSIENSLIGEQNAQKTLITMFALDEMGKSEEQWKIDRLENSIKAEERLSTSAAANSEILFSLMVNPSVLGAGMPGGPYSGNAGSGSDIREGLLVSMILSHIEKQQVLDPIELMLQYNGISDVELKYRNITLTTLDSGKSTTESLT